jgi:hypothetical protein
MGMENQKKSKSEDFFKIFWPCNRKMIAEK